MRRLFAPRPLSAPLSPLEVALLLGAAVLIAVAFMGGVSLALTVLESVFEGGAR